MYTGHKQCLKAPARDRSQIGAHAVVAVTFLRRLVFLNLAHTFTLLWHLHLAGGVFLQLSSRKPARWTWISSLVLPELGAIHSHWSRKEGRASI